MQYANPFHTPGVWLKGNTHTHTINSDGAWKPETMGAIFKRHGYDFTFLTDHNKRTVPPPSSRGALLIPAEEIHPSIGQFGYHIVCLGAKRAISIISKRRDNGKIVITPRYRSLTQLMQTAEREGFLPIIAHPHWSGNRSERFLKTKSYFWGMEIFNTVCHILNGKGYSTTHWDDLLDTGRRVIGLAADDTHGPGPSFGGGWIMVKAKARTETAIVRAIRRGCFYSTQGPKIKDITIKHKTIYVRCSPVKRIHFVGNRAYGGTRVAETGDLTKAHWKMHPECTYVRIECVDQFGKTAWSNPFFNA